MTRHFIPGIDDEYKFTRSEFAQLLGISPNALRMRMRKSKIPYDYVIKSGKYLFKRPRAQQDDRPPADHPNNRSMINAPLSLKKKTVNRGAHKQGKARYPNQAFEMQNEMMMLNSIQKKFKNERVRAKFERLNAAALKKIEKEVEQEDLRKLQERTKDDQTNNTNDGAYMMGNGGVKPNKYGHMLNATGLKRVEDRDHSKYDRWDEDTHKTKFVQRYDYNGDLRNTSLVDFSSTRKFSNPYWSDGTDDGSVEVSDYDIRTRTTPNPLGRELPDFSNEKNPHVAEEIWKLKNK